MPILKLEQITNDLKIFRLVADIDYWPIKSQLPAVFKLDFLVRPLDPL